MNVKSEQQRQNQLDPSKRNRQTVVVRQEKDDKATDTHPDSYFSIEGALSITTLAEAWNGTLNPIRRAKPKRVVIDAKKLDYCDGAGLGLFIEIRRSLAEWSGELQIKNLSPEMRQLLDMASLADPAAPQLRPPQRPGVIFGVGKATSLLQAKCSR